MLTVLQCKERFINAIATTTNRKSKRAYEIALDYLALVPDYVKIDPRNTKNGALNIGDIGELVLKYNKAISDSIKKRVLHRSPQGERDLSQYHKSEVKTFTVSNRHANGLSRRVGFTALLPQGTAWIPYEIAKQYVSLNERIKVATVKEMIKDHKIKIEPLQ